MWNSLSPAAREQFAWPHPGLPLPEEATTEHAETHKEDTPGPHQPPLAPFCLVILEPWNVDYLSLRGNRRIKFACDGQEGGVVWSETRVNP